MSACVDCCARCGCIVFFFNDTATTEIYTLSLHDALPISPLRTVQTREFGASTLFYTLAQDLGIVDLINAHVPPAPVGDRKSTRLNSSHLVISYAVFCLKKKNRGAARSSPVHRGDSAPSPS